MLWLKHTRAIVGAIAAVMFMATAYAYGPGASERMLVASQAVPKQPLGATPIRAAPLARIDRTPIVVFESKEGQAGYVHYFVITGPDGEPESQVGIELPNDRIAWSFPGLGITISPFIKSGAIIANNTVYEVEHLYGLRPFRDDAALRGLQRDLAERVAWWLDRQTPHCDEERPSNQFCVSCLGFVLRVLHPGTSPAVTSFPPDFKSARRNVYTTEDLLMYLAGVRIDSPREQRLSQIAALRIPETMRTQLVRIATSDDAAGSASSDLLRPRAARAKQRPVGRSAVQSPKRSAPHRRS